MRQAREAVEAATPEFRIEDGKLVFDSEPTYVLSRYLALVSALADLASRSRISTLQL